MALVDVPEPSQPGPGEVVIGSMTVGLCGSDYHFFSGHLPPEAGGGSDAFPKIQGHEVGGVVTAVGRGVGSELEPGRPVALHPLSHCGECYPCRVGRPNACDNFQLTGIHLDGGLQEQLVVPAGQVYPIGNDDAAIGAMAEPVSIGLRAVRRARIEAGEHVVVLGAGPIGQAVCMLARESDAEVLVVDPQEGRLDLSRSMGAEGLVWTDSDEVVAHARDWAGGEGVPVVVDATGVPQAIRAAVDMAASAGRVAQVGMSGQEVSLRVGWFTEKELDMLGVCCCGGGEFAEAVAAVERNPGIVKRLISHEFDLERAPEAMAFAISNPSEVMKVVIRGG
ncbi:MAG TPA: alcohol dehydrogenase catalytic domain-containing protein [Thermoleophilaceae bacterium]|jgi:L-gulonate 5-dehydrogenase|nr:alcohol dehydrogenase catalytic domain-containing protein [Thermoleophilaceae bacterium]